jgi:hypothetical protein
MENEMFGGIGGSSENCSRVRETQDSEAETVEMDGQKKEKGKKKKKDDMKGSLVGCAIALMVLLTFDNYVVFHSLILGFYVVMRVRICFCIL